MYVSAPGDPSPPSTSNFIPEFPRQCKEELMLESTCRAKWRVVQVEYSCASLQEARVRQTTIYFFASFSDALETTKATRK
jgi:hypothetical protein